MSIGDHERATLLCASLPGAEVSNPFGEGNDVWKVGGKIFAIVAADGSGVSVKTAGVDAASELIEQGLGEKAPYLHASWVRVPGSTAHAPLKNYVQASYRLIRGKLPKKVRETLGEMP